MAIGDSEKNTALKEAYLLESIAHTNIVKYVNTFVESQNIILIMELCEGDLKRRRPGSGNQKEERNKYLFQGKRDLGLV